MAAEAVLDRAQVARRRKNVKELLEELDKRPTETQLIKVRGSGRR